MTRDARLNDPGCRAAYMTNERQQRIKTGKVASALVGVLMPVGFSFDLAVYNHRSGFFLALRLFCAVLASGTRGPTSWVIDTTDGPRQASR